MVPPGVKILGRTFELSRRDRCLNDCDTPIMSVHSNRLLHKPHVRPSAPHVTLAAVFAANVDGLDADQCLDAIHDLERVAAAVEARKARLLARFALVRAGEPLAELAAEEVALELNTIRQYRGLPDGVRRGAGRAAPGHPGGVGAGRGRLAQGPAGGGADPQPDRRELDVLA